MNTGWDFSAVYQFRWALLSGLGTSVLLTALSALVGTALGVPLAIGLVSRSNAIRRIAFAWVESIRALPVLVVLVWVYYLAPAVLPVAPSAFWTALFVLTVNMSAFAADILRGGIRAIPQEHIEAGIALGMTRSLVFRRVIVPETFRRSVPALTAMYVNLFRLSTLASVISVWELFHVADAIILERFRPIEVYTAVAGLYLAVLLPLTWAARWVERQPWAALAPGAAHD